MAAINTNSNSMTAILVVALNNKKSGFRNQFLQLIAVEDEGYQFEDGTHSSIEYPEINGKEVDVVGKVNGKTVLLIEVKVNRYEDLQPSQAKNGEYEKVFKKHRNDLKKLVYIIPDDYMHESEIPKSAICLKWTLLLEIAENFDNTGFSEYINNFVELPIDKGSVLFTKGELFMLMNQNAFCTALGMGEKIIELAKNLTITDELEYKKEERGPYGYGSYFSYKGIDECIFIGLNPSVENEDFFFAFDVHNDLNIKNKPENSFPEEEWTYISFPKDEVYQEFMMAKDEEQEQNAFNKMISNVLKSLQV